MTLDNDVVINLAQAMAYLEILQLGGHPPSGVTFEGHIVLALRCPQLQAPCSFSGEQIGRGDKWNRTTVPMPGVPQKNWAPTNLQVGETPILEQEALPVPDPPPNFPHWWSHSPYK